MTETQKVAWKRLTVEAAAIIGSILLAFAIDAWWNDIQQRDDERLILASLLEEFRAKKALLDNSRAYNQAILASTKKLLYAAVESDRELGEDSIDRLLGDLWFNNYPSRWSAATLDSLILSGDLILISNKQLRHQLGAWTVQFDTVRETVAMEVDFYHHQFIPFLAANASLPQIINVIDHIPGGSGTRYQYGKKFSLAATNDHSELLSSQEFQNILVERSVLLTDIITQAFANIDQPLNATIRELEEELAK